VFTEYYTVITRLKVPLRTPSTLISGIHRHPLSYPSRVFVALLIQAEPSSCRATQELSLVWRRYRRGMPIPEKSYMDREVSMAHSEYRELKIYY
jgi:hypothetical protein